jgi:hypothetical protein
MKFFVGLDNPHQAKHVPRAFISVNRLKTRRKPVTSGEWIMDSGAFTELATHGCFRNGPEEYSRVVNRIASASPNLLAAVSQDWMCEPWILEKTGLTVVDHQRLTIERYDQLLELVSGVYLMPVLQGYRVEEYLRHIDDYGDRLKSRMLVGIGSVCKRNGDVRQIETIITAIKTRNPQLKLHAFGLKTTALRSDLVRRYLYSADSMAWSYAARRQGRNQHDWREAMLFASRMETMPIQGWLFHD